jgi:2-polyprenyl-6-methoxyphenol hydroxylase-like FAD-dependent oxidoreductase
MRILVSGAGIAGPTLAWWLLRHGLTPTLVESAPRLRTGGYVIDFWGAGFEVADRMGLLPEIQRQGYVVREVRAVGAAGRRVAGFRADAFARALQGRFVSLSRGDLAAILYDALEGRVETLFGDCIERLDQNESGVQVTFRSGRAREFDLVLGADGLHSRVRQLVFGQEPRFEHYLGCKAAAFSVDGYRPRDELVYVLYSEVGRQVARFSMRDDRTMFLFTWREADPSLPGSFEEQKAALRRRFGNSGWECPQILDALDGATDLYYDRVSQIRMEPEAWHHGRVALLGDAASCVSLLAGQGSALAMVAAYILAGELYRAQGDYAGAFARYGQLWEPFVRGKQQAALRMASFFAPPSQTYLFLRNRVMNLMSLPGVARLSMGTSLTDKIVVPSY